MTGTPRARRARWVDPLTWLAAIALVALLLARVSWAEFRAAWAGHASAAFVLWVVALAALPLPLDAWATRRAFARLGLELGRRELLLARGASYLPGLLHSAAGQGGLLVYLVRRGVALGRASVAMLFVAATQALGLIALAAVAAGRGLPAAIARPLAGSLAALALGGVAYLALIAAGPRRLGVLGRVVALEPLFATGVRGHLAAAGERLPHLLSLVLVSWGAFRLWGIALPWPDALALVPPVLLVGMLPLTPGGLGAVQAAQLLLFASYAPGASAAARQADVLACGLTGHVLGLAAQAAIGLLCLARLRATTGAAPPPVAAP